MFEGLKSWAMASALLKLNEATERNVLAGYLHQLNDHLERKDFVNRLDQCVGDCNNVNKSVEDRQKACKELAEAIYNTVMPQASMLFVKLHNNKDKELDSLCGGIQAYVKTSDEGKEAFKRQFKIEKGFQLDPLARRLRVLKPDEKECYLKMLNQLEKENDERKGVNWETLAKSMYQAFNGQSVQDPEEVKTWKDKQEGIELDVICNGIRDYLRAPSVEKMAFWRKVRRPATLVDKFGCFIRKKALSL